MKLILITAPTYFVEEDKILTALFEEGLEVLHLRKPDTAPIYAERLLTLIPEQYHKRIIVHDHFYLKDEFSLKGIHVSKRNSEIPLNYKGIKSCSCHSLNEIKEKKNEYDYLFLSPIFDSISKENYKSAFSKDTLLKANKENIIGKHIIALGGINESNIKSIKEYGFGGAAILGALWNKFNVCEDKDYSSLIKHFRNIKKLSD